MTIVANVVVVPVVSRSSSTDAGQPAFFFGLWCEKGRGRRSRCTGERTQIDHRRHKTRLVGMFDLVYSTVGPPIRAVHGLMHANCCTSSKSKAGYLATITHRRSFSSQPLFPLLSPPRFVALILSFINAGHG